MVERKTTGPITIER